MKDKPLHVWEEKKEPEQSQPSDLIPTQQGCIKEVVRNFKDFDPPLAKSPLATTTTTATTPLTHAATRKGNGAPTSLSP